MRALLLAVAVVTLPAMAGDVCPEGCIKSTPPTCEQRIARARKAGCEFPTTIKIVDRQVPVPVACDPCDPCKACPEPVTVVRTEYIQTPPPPGPSGQWLVGAGPAYFHGLGVAAIGGYRFASGWQIQAGPLWIPQDDKRGEVTDGCVTLPYHVAAPSPWGAQVLAVYAF